ncbi:MAG: hypothetical protein ABR520_01815 [Mycobacteriales bacterium]|nr:hypothetical protein [Frankia sp.]
MRRIGLAATAAAAVLLLATPSSAAPDRSVTLSRGTRTASWHSGFLVGTNLGFAPLYALTRCLDWPFSCDDTLIRLTGPGDLTVTVAGPATGPDADFILQGFDLFLFRSDAAGTTGAGLTTTRSRGSGSAHAASYTANRLRAGHYLAQVWRSEGVADYNGTAVFKPTK